MSPFRIQTVQPLTTDKLVTATALAVAYACYQLRRMKGCGNTDVLNQVASGAIADGVFAQINDLTVVCRISEGRKDRHPRLAEGMLLTRPAANDQAAAAIVDPVECEGQYALSGRRS